MLRLRIALRRQIAKTDHAIWRSRQIPQTSNTEGGYHGAPLQRPCQVVIATLRRRFMGPRGRLACPHSASRTAGLGCLPRAAAELLLSASSRQNQAVNAWLHTRYVLLLVPLILRSTRGSIDFGHDAV